MSATRYPQTVAQAVDLLRNHLPDEALDYLRSMETEDKAVSRIDFGESVHELLGLGHSNTALLAETGSRTIADASSVLLRALWRHVRQSVH